MSDPQYYLKNDQEFFLGYGLNVIPCTALKNQPRLWYDRKASWPLNLNEPSIELIFQTLEAFEQEHGIDSPKLSESAWRSVRAVDAFIQSHGDQHIVLPHTISGWTNSPPERGGIWEQRDIDALERFKQWIPANRANIKVLCSALSAKRYSYLTALGEIQWDPIRHYFFENLRAAKIDPHNQPPTLTKVLGMLKMTGRDIRLHMQQYDYQQMDQISLDVLPELNWLLQQDSYGSRDDEQWPHHAITPWNWLHSLQGGIKAVPRLLKAQAQPTQQDLEQTTHAYALWLGHSGGFLSTSRHASDLQEVRLFPSIAAAQRTIKGAAYGDRREPVGIIKLSLEGLEENLTQFAPYEPVFAQWCAQKESDWIRTYAASPDDPLDGSSPSMAFDQSFGPTASAQEAVVLTNIASTEPLKLMFYGNKEWVSFIGGACPSKDYAKGEYTPNPLGNMRALAHLSLKIAPIALVQWVGEPVTPTEDNHLEQLHASIAHHRVRVQHEAIRRQQEALLRQDQTQQIASASSTKVKRRL